MKRIIEYFINRSFVVNLISAFIILAGLTMATMIKRDMIPPFAFKKANISIKLPGASATEIEKYLAYPVEQALKGLPHATEITTTSSFGRLRSDVYFNAGHDEMDESVEQIRSRIDAISWQLPEESRDIKVEQDKVTSVFHMGIALVGFEQTNSQHRALAKKIANEIQAVKGILRVFKEYNAENIYVKIKPEKIKQNEISISEIRRKLQQALNFSPIGQVDFNEKTYSVEVERPAEAIDTLKRLATRGNSTGDILYLEDVADVTLEIDEIKEIDRFNGKPAINLWTRKDVISDTIDLKAEVQKVLDRNNDILPEGLSARIFIDQPKLIQNQLTVLKKNGIFGMIIVLLILTLFFNWRVSLVTSFGIPIAYCGTLIALFFCGISIDLISVVGMILVLGILVDDAIIIAERYMDNLESGLKPKEAATEASRDLMVPVTGTVLTTVFAFSPMILLESEMSIIFFAIPVVVIVSLIMSWLESFFILPNHLQHFIKTAPKTSFNTKFFEKVKKSYEIVLAGILKFRYAVVVFLIGFFALSYWVAKNKIQQEWWFGDNRERIVVKVFLNENKSLEFTEQKVKPIEDYLLSLPKDKIEAVNSSIGEMWSMGRLYSGYRYAKVMAHIHSDITNPGAVKQEFTKQMKAHFKKYQADNPDIEKIVVGFEANDEDDKKRQIVSIEVTGNEDVDYLDIKDQVEAKLKKNKIPLQLVKEDNEFDEKWVFKPNTRRMAQYNMSLQAITSQLRSFFVPHEVMQIRMNGETKWIYTQVQRAKTISKEQLNKMTVLNNIDLPVPLKSLGTWSKKKQLGRIQHKDGKRLFTFDLKFEESDSMNVVKAKKLSKEIATSLAQKFPTYSVNVKDGDRAEANTRSWAGKVALLCIVLVMFTLALVLGSVTLPLLVGLPIPFGLMGIVWALYLHDMKMGIMSLIGLVGTVGVAVNDSLIMVDQIMKRGRSNGGLTREHIIAGASSRLRAIILTTVTTLGGVFPMAYGIGGESGFTQPLAFSLGWGLFFSTFLTLFALPAFIEIRSDVGRLFTRFKNRLFPESQTSVVVESKNPIIEPQIPEDFVAHDSTTAPQPKPNPSL